MGEEADNLAHLARRVEEHRDDLFRGLGRYMFEFSRLIVWMRLLIVKRLAPEDEGHLVELLFGESTAHPFVNSYFALCVQSADLTDREKKIAGVLRDNAQAEVNRRNDIAHGDWTMGWVGETDATKGHPRISRTRPTRLKTPYSEVVYGPAEFRVAINDVWWLRTICLGVMPGTLSEGRTVAQTFRIEGSSNDPKVVRIEPGGPQPQ